MHKLPYHPHVGQPKGRTHFNYFSRSIKSIVNYLVTTCGKPLARKRPGKFPRRDLPRRRNLSAARIIHRPIARSGRRINCRSVHHRPGYHPDLFYLYPTQKISGRRTSPQSCANAGRLTGDDFVTAGAAKRGGKKSGKHHRKRLNQTAQIDHARGIAAK